MVENSGHVVYITYISPICRAYGKGVYNNKTVSFRVLTYLTVSYKVVSKGTPYSFFLSASFTF